MTGPVTYIDIDVIGDFPRRFDKTIDAFRKQHPHAIVARTVADMVDKVNRKLHPEVLDTDSPLGIQILQGPTPTYKIRRLRIFGHSPGSYVALSRFDSAIGQVRSPEDFSQTTETQALGAYVLGFGDNERLILHNADDLEKLSGAFAPDGYVELHACHIAPGFSGDLSQSKIDHGPHGLYLMKGLAKMWQVPVLGGSDKQNINPGLEGEVFIVHPNLHIDRVMSDKLDQQQPLKSLHKPVKSGPSSQIDRPDWQQSIRIVQETPLDVDWDQLRQGVQDSGSAQPGLSNRFGEDSLRESQSQWRPPRVTMDIDLADRIRIHPEPSFQDRIQDNPLPQPIGLTGSNRFGEDQLRDPQHDWRPPQLFSTRGAASPLDSAFDSAHDRFPSRDSSSVLSGFSNRFGEDQLREPQNDWRPTFSVLQPDRFGDRFGESQLRGHESNWRPAQNPPGWADSGTNLLSQLSRTLQQGSQSNLPGPREPGWKLG